MYHMYRAGLVRRFYRPRWQAFVTAVVAALSAGKPFEQAAVTRSLTVWEEVWISNASNTAASFGTETQGSSGGVAKALCAKYVRGCV
jgi:alpha-N-acetylglucosaminidase